jgi:UDP-N-acetylglucosamine 2-epimerase (non-hydrolysing)
MRRLDSAAVTSRSIVAVYGTRPEAIKLAPVLHALAAHAELDPIVVVTGQHRELLDPVNAFFGVVPARDLRIFEPGLSLSEIVARTLTRLDPVLAELAPAAVLVQGDTSTALAAALAAFHRRVPVVHLEAGLRSGDLAAPFPEEANRRLVTQVAALHLAPGQAARAHLLAAGVTADRIVVTGNTVVDALDWAVAHPSALADPALEAVVTSGRRLVLVTCHRRESWDGALAGIGRAVARLAEQFPDIAVVVPVHPNPVVREALEPALRGRPNVTLTGPLPYGQFARLLAASHLVLTDSGGLQEEAPGLGIPLLVLRQVTERPEALAAGTSRLVGVAEEQIVAAASRLLADPAAYATMAHPAPVYGDGQAARRSAEAIAWFLGVGARPDEFGG